MPSTSKKQARFMTAACKNAEFRKKVGISKDVACDFHDADKGKWHESLDEGNDNAIAAGNELLRLLKSHPKARFIEINKPEVSHGQVMCGVRDFGNWVVPDDVEDDGDYDWEIPTDETLQIVDRIKNTVEQEYNVKITPSVEEKNWIDFYIKEIVKESAMKITESFLSPLEKIALRIHNGEFAGQAPKMADKEVQRKFRDAVRETYGHSFNDEKTRNIFNQAWFTGKDDWKKLAEEYDRITREVAPETILDANAIKVSVIAEADVLMKDSNFLANPKEIRRQILVKFIKDKVAEALQDRLEKRSMVQSVIEHYEDKFGVQLKQMLSEDDDELEDLEPLETGDDLDAALDSGEEEEDKEDDLDTPIEHNPTDTVKFDVPFLIRILEFAREEAKSDNELHRMATNLIQIGKEGNTLTMDNFEAIIANIKGSEINYLRHLAGIANKKEG